MLMKVHGNSVLSVIRKQKFWCGFIVPDKVEQADIMDNKILGYFIQVRSVAELRKEVEAFKQVACYEETGYNVRYYQYISFRQRGLEDEKEIFNYTPPPPKT
jgi:hypothetical protein